MDSVIRGREEIAQQNLRSLFERRGFRRVSVPKFEDYDLYIDNKNFLGSEHIITFMDMDGKLRALKPDVTLSIVKNVSGKALQSFEKLYYVDEVYRLSRENREYKVLDQIGVELIGPADDFSNIEIVDLALESLALIGERYVLDISHIGLVSGLLEESGISHSSGIKILDAIHSKSAHNLRGILEEEGVSERGKADILALAELHGPLSRMLPQLKELICSPQMEEAYRELAHLAEVLNGGEAGSRVNLDFSVVGDLDYYNGLVFAGYVQGVPTEVLSGGRYDNLMKKMGKASCALGFGVYLTELGVYQKGEVQSDFDILLTYPEGCDHGALLAAVRKLTAEGNRVRTERENVAADKLGFTYDRRYRFESNILMETL